MSGHELIYMESVFKRNTNTMWGGKERRNKEKVWINSLPFFLGLKRITLYVKEFACQGASFMHTI